MLDFQLQQAPLAFGLAEGVDPHHAPFGTLMTAENCRWVRGGRLEKRHGFTFLSSVPSGIVRLFVRNAELSGIDASGVVYSQQASGSWVTRAARAPSLNVTRGTAFDTVASAKSADMTIMSDGSMVYAWVTGSLSPSFQGGGQVYYRIVDANGNETTAATMAYNAGASNTDVRVRVVSSGTSWMLVFVDAGKLYAFNSNGIATLQTDVWNSLSYGPFDAVAMGSAAIIVYFNGTNMRVCSYTFGSPPTLSNSSLVTGETALITNIGIDATAGENIYITYSTTPGNLTRYTVRDAGSLGNVISPATLDSVASRPTTCRVSSQAALIVWTVPQGTTGRLTGEVRYCIVGTSGLAVSGQKFLSGLSACSKPFVYNGRYYVIANEQIGVTRFSGETLLLDITTERTSAIAPIGTEASHVDALVGGSTVGYQVPQYNGSAYALAPFVSSQFAYGYIRQGARLVTMRQMTTTDTMMRPVKYGPEVYFSGAVVTSYDGDNVVPMGASTSPQIYSATPSTTGGTFAAGTYAVNLYSERRNQAGVLHRGPTGIAKNFTTTGTTGSVALVVTPVWAGATTDPTGFYGTDILLPIYVSQAGQSVLQRWTVDTQTGVLYDAYTGSANSLSATVTSVPSTASPAIYTASGELDDYQPPASLFLTEHQNRLWSVGPDGYTVWFSKDSTVNPGVAPGFHPSLTLSFNDPIVALASMDSGLLAFTATGLYVIQGDGPAPNGQGATYQAVKVQTDVGCTNPRSVVSMPDGVMFQSTRGLYLVSRGLEVVFVGKTIQSTTRNASVTSAVLVARRGEVRFALSTGVSAVYNYFEKQWSTAKYTSGGVYGSVIVDACMWNGSYTVLFADGNIASESETSYLDGSSWVPMTLETSWNNSAGPLAYQSVRMFSAEGYSSSDHKLTVSVGFDNETTYAQTYTWQDGSQVTSVGPFERFEVSIGVRRKCQSIRFKMQDAAPTTLAVGTGQGPAFDALGVQVGVKRGFTPKPVGRSA